MKSSNCKGKKEKKFSLLLFVVVVKLTLALLFMAVALVAPKVWRVQITASWGSILTTVLVIHFACSFMEFFFHRYVLHAPLIPFLAHFYKQHTRHHALTRVRMRKPARIAPEVKPVVENLYPILEEAQYEASFFPWYALLVFAAVATPALVITQWLLPQTPVFLGGFLGIAWSLSLYEIFHAIEHLPLEKWLPLLKHQKWGSFWKVVYAFHLRHHADIHCNEAISGFFGLPIPDWVFGTWINPKTLYGHGEIIREEEFKSRGPRIIGWIDNLARSAIDRRRNVTT